METSRVPTRSPAATDQPVLRRALVLADSRALRTLMALALRREGVEVVPSRHANDLRSVMRSDLVLVGPPELSVDIMKRIEELARLPRRPAIVAVVTDSGHDYQQALLRAGADRVVTMPFGAGQLWDAACAAAEDRGQL